MILSDILKCIDFNLSTFIIGVNTDVNSEWYLEPYLEPFKTVIKTQDLVSGQTYLEVEGAGYNQGYSINPRKLLRVLLKNKKLEVRNVDYTVHNKKYNFLFVDLFYLGDTPSEIIRDSPEIQSLMENVFR